MPGEPWPDLEQKIASGEVKGSWPAARDDWGKYSSKLEAVFLVAVPSEANRNPARILPGRNDVFIIPRSDCTPGFEGDSNVYFSPKNIKACLVLKPPSNAAELAPQLKTLTRVQCSTQHGKKGMYNLRLSPIAADATVIDIDKGKQFAPKITQFTMSIAHPTDAVSVVKDLHDSPLQLTFSSQQLWLEDMARLQRQEMAAGIVGVEQLLTRAYTMAYYYTTIERANTICKRGIPTVRDGSTRGLTVCLLPPSAQELGWHSNAGGSFKQRVAALLGMEADDVQAMVLLGVPTCAVEQAGCMGQAAFTLVEPSRDLTFLQKTERGDVVYSKAQIAKVWTLEATAVVEARQAAWHVRAGKKLKDAFAGQTAGQIEQAIQEQLDARGGEKTTHIMKEGVPPIVTAETGGGVAGELHLHDEVGELRVALEKEKREKQLLQDKLDSASRAPAQRSSGGGGGGSRPCNGAGATGTEVAETTRPTEEGVPPTAAPETAGGAAAGWLNAERTQELEKQLADVQQQLSHAWSTCERLEREVAITKLTSIRSQQRDDGAAATRAVQWPVTPGTAPQPAAGCGDIVAGGSGGDTVGSADADAGGGGTVLRKSMSTAEEVDVIIDEPTSPHYGKSGRFLDYTPSGRFIIVQFEGEPRPCPVPISSVTERERQPLTEKAVQLPLSQNVLMEEHPWPPLSVSEPLAELQVGDTVFINDPASARCGESATVTTLTDSGSYLTARFSDTGTTRSFARSQVASRSDWSLAGQHPAQQSPVPTYVTYS